MFQTCNVFRAVDVFAECCRIEGGRRWRVSGFVRARTGCRPLNKRRHHGSLGRIPEVQSKCAILSHAELVYDFSFCAQCDFPDLDKVDVEGDAFAALPSEMQHEMLVQLIEKRRENSWAKIDTLPEV